MSEDVKAKPEIILNLDKPRRFKFNFKALLLLKEKLAEGREDFNLVKWLGELEHDFDIDHVAAMLWAGLAADDKTLTFDQALDILDIIGLYQSKDLVIEAMNRAMPGLKERFSDFLSSRPLKK